MKELKAYECPNCGASVEITSSKCPYCGTPLNLVTSDSGGLFTVSIRGKHFKCYLSHVKAEEINRFDSYVAVDGSILKTPACVKHTFTFVEV